MKQRPILTVTLNPALDLTTTAPRLEPQRKLRCTAPRYDPGGGGVNVSRVIHELDGRSAAFVAIAGSTGVHLAGLLKQQGVDARFWEVSGETRTSFTVMEEQTGLHYRFVLPGPEQPPAEAETLLSAVMGAMPEGCAYVVLSGSLLPGLPADFYGRLTKRVQDRGAAVILDAHGMDLKAALASRPHIIRVNHLEAAELTGIADPGASARMLSQRLIEQQVAEVVLVSLGDQGTVVATQSSHFQVRPPVVSVRSMVGAGDSFVGAFTLALARNRTLEDATRFGVAAAAAAVTTEGTSLCDRAMTERLHRQIVHEASAAR